VSAGQASDSAPLWEGFEKGQLLLPFCNDCGQPHLPAGPVCPYCLSAALTWKQASGKARLSTWVVERRKFFDTFEPPYIVAEVQLAEGPRMPVQVEIEHLPELRAAVPGTIAFKLAGNGLTLPQFVPDERS
jgi:uncharacterized OB-fold protein